jgi:hypothetical protein
MFFGRLSAGRWCQPAPSRTTTAWTPSGRVLAKASKNRRVARVETSGSTRVKSSPVSGRTALKM